MQFAHGFISKPLCRIQLLFNRLLLHVPLPCKRLLTFPALIQFFFIGCHLRFKIIFGALNIIPKPFPLFYGGCLNVFIECGIKTLDVRMFGPAVLDSALKPEPFHIPCVGTLHFSQLARLAREPPRV